MPIISQADATTEVGYPGVIPRGYPGLSLYISHLEIGPGGRVTTHIHPDSEEAMVIVEGSLNSVTLGEGELSWPLQVRKPVRRYPRLLAIFPKTQFERVPMAIGLCEAAWGLIRNPPPFDRLTTNGRKPFALSLSGRAQD